jgi:hypothetical protein
MELQHGFTLPRAPVADITAVHRCAFPLDPNFGPIVTLKRLKSAIEIAVKFATHKCIHPAN